VVVTTQLTGIAFSGNTKEQSVLVHSLLPMSARNKQCPSLCISLLLPSLSPAHPQKLVIPLGVTPQIISSLDTGDLQLPTRSGSKVVHRKSMSGHSIMAEATRAIVHVMAREMRAIAKAGRELERSKIDVQFKLFS